MRVVRVQVDEMAAPLVALECDGAVYDVAALEESWGWGGWSSTFDFHGRVFSMRCAGLGEVDARLKSGDRPGHTRLWPADYVPLPPCVPDRCAYFQMAPHDLERSEPGFVQRDARALVGTGQPAAVLGGAEAVEVGIAALIAEEMSAVGPREAERGILGYSLIADWARRADRWHRLSLSGEAPSQLGPAIAVGLPASVLARSEVWLEVGVQRRALETTRLAYTPGEAVAFVSRHVRLCPGDVVGLGAMALVSTERLREGARVALEVRGIGRLDGWSVDAPPPPPWRLPRRG